MPCRFREAQWACTALAHAVVDTHRLKEARHAVRCARRAATSLQESTGDLQARCVCAFAQGLVWYDFGLRGARSTALARLAGRPQWRTRSTSWPCASSACGAAPGAGHGARRGAAGAAQPAGAVSLSASSAWQHAAHSPPAWPQGPDPCGQAGGGPGRAGCCAGHS